MLHSIWPKKKKKLLWLRPAAQAPDLPMPWPTARVASIDLISTIVVYLLLKCEEWLLREKSLLRFFCLFWKKKKGQNSVEKKEKKKPIKEAMFWRFVGPLLVFSLCGIVSNPGLFQSNVSFHIWSIVGTLFVLWHLWYCFKLMPISALSWLPFNAHNWPILFWHFMVLFQTHAHFSP